MSSVEFGMTDCGLRISDCGLGIKNHRGKGTKFPPWTWSSTCTVLVPVVVIGVLLVAAMLRQVLVASLEIVPVNPQSAIRN